MITTFNKFSQVQGKCLIVLTMLISACLGSFETNSGQILFASNRQGLLPALFLVDISSLETTSIIIGSEPLYQPNWSPDGDRIIYASNTIQEDYKMDQIYSAREDGSDQILIFNSIYAARDPVYSPDGSKIAFLSNVPNTGDVDIFVMDADGSNLSNSSNHPGIDKFPTWSPDGNKIAFTSNRDGNQEIYIMNANGTGQANISNHPANDFQPSWSPDGNKIAFTSNRDDPSANKTPPTVIIPFYTIEELTKEVPAPVFTAVFSPPLNSENLEVYIMNSDGSNQLNISNDPFNDSQPDWSPDGRKIAFVSDRDGNEEIYIMSLDGSNQINITNSPLDDYSPAWKPE